MSVILPFSTLGALLASLWGRMVRFLRFPAEQSKISTVWFSVNLEIILKVKPASLLLYGESGYVCMYLLNLKIVRLFV